MPYQYQTQKKKKAHMIPIKIQGLGTFYISRKMALLGALVGTGLILGLGVFLWYIQTVPVCNFVQVGC